MCMITIRVSAVEAALLQQALVKELRACPEEGAAIDLLFEKLKPEDWPYPGRQTRPGRRKKGT